MQIIYKLKKPMMVFYCFLSPIAIGVILLASWAQYAPITRWDKYLHCLLFPYFIDSQYVLSSNSATSFTASISRGDYVYPGWANGIGWLIAMTAILSVPIMAIVTVVAAYRKRPEEGVLAAFNRLLLLYPEITLPLFTFFPKQMRK